MILALRTDTAKAEINVYGDDGVQVVAHTWQADRQLAKELLGVIVDRLDGVGASFKALTGIVVYQGPGSFTGLRIGITVANTIAYGQNIPIVSASGDDWTAAGLQRLHTGDNDRIVLPHYGAEANISVQKR